jgi:hypothetical protein
MLYPLSYEGARDEGGDDVSAGQTIHSGSRIPRALRFRALGVPNRSVSNGFLNFVSRQNKRASSANALIMTQ